MKVNYATVYRFKDTERERESRTIENDAKLMVNQEKEREYEKETERDKKKT